MIQHISIFKDGKRIIIKPDKHGKFRVMDGVRTISSAPRAKYLSSVDFVKHSSIKDHDPTITLESGEKLRVYHAGNSTIPLVHPSLVLEKFDRESKKRKKTLLEKKLDSLKKSRDDAKRKDETTKPMASAPPIAPPFLGTIKTSKSVTVSNAPPQRSASDPTDPFSTLIDEWFGTDEELDDPNDGLYTDGYPFDDYDEGS